MLHPSHWDHWHPFLGWLTEFNGANCVGRTALLLLMLIFFYAKLIVSYN